MKELQKLLGKLQELGFNDLKLQIESKHDEVDRVLLSGRSLFDKSLKKSK